MIDNYNEYSKISPLYGGSLPLMLKQIQHYSGFYLHADCDIYRDSSFGYTSFDQFLIKTNYPKEVLRDIKLAIENKQLLDISVSNVFYSNKKLFFELEESYMDCTKIYLAEDYNAIPVKYISYIEMGDYKWGSYPNL